jgi:hypothetical protein
VIRPVETDRLDRRKIVSKLGQAVKILPHSVRLRLPDLTMPWAEALDTILDAVDAATPLPEVAAV